MQIRTKAFAEGSPIPAKFTCEGSDCSPPLEWDQVPASAQSLALLVDDPDAPSGTWTHWIVFNLAPGTGGLPEDMPRTQYLPGGARQGLNDFKRLGYGGPCPPAGRPHRYFFRLYALDCVLDLRPGIARVELERAMHGHVLDQGQVMGTYQRH
jgi:Raf kinase inhibitor-like YbhB/YbcL family protein